jgi:5-deoxy-glucuronate isomerase
MTHLIHAATNSRQTVKVTPSSAAWKFLSFSVLSLRQGETHSHETNDMEVAVVPLSGNAMIEVDDAWHLLSRRDVFAEKSAVLYVPPGLKLQITAETNCELAIGAAPAEGKYPVRLIKPSEIRAEVRGGGAARRQVHHLLAHPLPAEQLIVYEVFVPGGNWAGWPPHCHDGYEHSPYLEETYYFRLDPVYGFGLHRNWRVDRQFDETFTVRHGDVVLVTQGFHSTTAAPNCRLYFLNFLAGDLHDDDRRTPPFDEPQFAWIKQDWTANSMQLPLF